MATVFDDSVAQLVEHNTFNVRVVSSSLTRITCEMISMANVILSFCMCVEKLIKNRVCHNPVHL